MGNITKYFVWIVKSSKELIDNYAKIFNIGGQIDGTKKNVFSKNNR